MQSSNVLHLRRDYTQHIPFTRTEMQKYTCSILVQGSLFETRESTVSIWGQAYRYSLLTEPAIVPKFQKKST